MLNQLRTHFPEGRHYLVFQRHEDEINSYFEQALYTRFQFLHKNELWSKASEQLPHWGRLIGWVPDHFQLLFLSESVEMEIAEAIALKKNQFTVGLAEIEAANLLLTKLKIAHLAKRNPFFLSQGETKMLWLLCQWAKFPEHLIIGNLPAHLSQQRLPLVFDFLTASDQLAQELGFHGPTIILGCEHSQHECYSPLLEHITWEVRDQWPLSNEDNFSA
ncbi:hypothetical protein L0Z72_14030 [candidate division KSB1 bacterium]|nr:hypothetical protein [candidate division KSB1 bacterium]